MAEIDLTLKTTQILIVCTFVILTIYFNFILIRSSLDILFWATITSIPLIGLKNSATLISPYLSNINGFKKYLIAIFIFILAKAIIFDQSKNFLLASSLVLLYIIIEKTFRKNSISNIAKLSILALFVAFVLISTSYSILEELKFIAINFDFKGFITENYIRYFHDLITQNFEKNLDELNYQHLLPKFQKCGLNYENLGDADNFLNNINFTSLKNIFICLGNEYKNQLINIINASKPIILKGLKRTVFFAESGFGAISRFITYISTVYIMTTQSIQPMRVMDLFLLLIDESGYLSREFNEIVNDLILYNTQKLILSCFATFIAFSIFSMNIIAIPVILSAVAVLIPGSPTYIIPFIGIIELIFLQKPFWHIIFFIIVCNRCKFYCDKLITLKVSLVNSKSFLLQL